MNDVAKSSFTETESAGTKQPPSDSQADRLLRLVHWTSSASRQLRRRLADVGQALSLSDTELLVIWLCSGGGRVQVELAGLIGISPAQMSGMVERLRSRGLVAMHRLAMDRRRQVWRTSPSGQALLARAAHQFNELAACIRSSLNDDEQQLAQSLCERLAEAAASGCCQQRTKTVAAQSHDEQLASKEAA